MARGSLAPETRIISQLSALGCSHRNFAAIAKIPYGSFAAVMAGTKDLEYHGAQRLLDVLQRMRELQADIGDLPLDWSRTDKISHALVVRLVAKVSHELYGGNVLAEEANEATAALGQQ